MKTRTYTEKNYKFGIYCPNCHQELLPPMKGGGTINGSFTLGCGRCKNGKVILKLGDVNIKTDINKENTNEKFHK